MSKNRDLSLDGAVAVVTGGGSGIGRAISCAYREAGAQVSIWDRDAAAAERVAREVGALATQIDVREADEVDAALETTIATLGVPTILVNNAGGVFWSPLLETSAKGWDSLIGANLTQVLLCTQRVARAMVEAERAGSVINVASIDAVRAAPGYAAYAAAKAGVVSFTRTAALELAGYGIRVNCLAPDLTVTQGISALMAPDMLRVAEYGIPLGRAGDVDEVANAALFLASELSSYVTGQVLHVDGGTSAAGGWYQHPDREGYVLGAAGAFDGNARDGVAAELPCRTEESVEPGMR